MAKRKRVRVHIPHEQLSFRLEQTSAQGARPSMPANSKPELKEP
ncbi:hypothetical protein [Shewanella salipaludis]|nr:hypothetical protein [Shewanella salipaludis]